MGNGATGNLIRATRDEPLGLLSAVRRLGALGGFVMLEQLCQIVDDNVGLGSVQRFDGTLPLDCDDQSESGRARGVYPVRGRLKVRCLGGIYTEQPAGRGERVRSGLGRELLGIDHFGVYALIYQMRGPARSRISVVFALADTTPRRIPTRCAASK